MTRFHIPSTAACLASALALAGSNLLAPFVSAARAQVPTPKSDSWRVQGRVIDAHHQPLARVLVKFESPDVEWTGPSLLTTDVYGEFQTPLGFLPRPKEGRGELGVIILKAEKEGYHPGWDLLDRATLEKGEASEIVLQDEDRIGNLPIPQTVVTELAGHYSKQENLEPVSPAARDDCMHGAKDFFRGEDPIKGALRLRKAAEIDPACQGCQFLMGLAYFQGGAWRRAEAALTQVSSADSSETARRIYADARAVLSVMKILSDDWEEARKLLAAAVDADASSPFVLRELGRFLMFQGQLERADQCFKDALEKGATPELHLLRAETFLLRQQLPEARIQYRFYWDKAFPFNRTGRAYWAEARSSPYARYILAEIRTMAHFESYGRVESVTTLPLAKAMAAHPPLRGIKPAESQQALPPLLDQMGAAVEDLISRLPNTISDEQVIEKRMGANGKVKDGHEFRMQYLLLLRPKWATTFAVEHRLNPSREADARDSQTGIWLTTINSIMSMTLFLPRHRAGVEFRVLGTQDLGGRVTHVIGFAQRPLVSKVQGKLKSNNFDNPYMLQGLIWLDHTTGQILRVRSELLKPLKDAGIKSYSTDVDYAETRVGGAPGTYWLPQRISVRVESQFETYDGQHTFSNYRLYTAESTIKTEVGDLP